MSKEILPLSFPQQTAKIYAGFGSRLAARFIDLMNKKTHEKRNK